MNPATTQHYERLPGIGHGFGTYGTLYLGEDHLLSVTTMGYSQEYKRFYFHDIQAIIIRRTILGRTWSLAWAGCALILTMLILNATETFTQQLLGGILGICLVGLAINTALGPTCVSHIRTAVQSERLPSLRRLRKTMLIVNRLQPLIATAQSTWPQPPASSASPSAAPEVEGNPPVIEPGPAPQERGVPGEDAGGAPP